MISGIFLCSGHFEGHFACVCHWFLFPCANVNFKITQELRMNTSSNTATHNSKSFKLTLWYSNIAADNSPQMMFPTINFNLWKAPRLWRGNFPRIWRGRVSSDMTRALGCDARCVFAWQAWHLVPSMVPLCGTYCAWWHRRCVSVVFPRIWRAVCV